MNDTKLPKRGSIEVICGPMFSGKSEELIRRLRRAKIAKQEIIVFKPKLDTRRGIDKVSSHNGAYIEAVPVDQLEIVTEYLKQHIVHVIGFDEVQFFPENIISIICNLVEQGKRIIIAGLDLDFRGIPFGSIPTLLAIADHITKLQAICTQCGQDAHFSQRLVDNIPARFDDPIIQLGAQESYQARCRNCYIIDKQPRFCQYLSS